MNKRLVLMLAAIMVLSGYAAAGTGTSGAQFLKIMPSASVSALGETGATITGTQSIYINPAGLASVENIGLDLSQAGGLESVSYSNIAAVKKFSFGTLGLGINMLSVPSMAGYDNNGTPEDAYSASDSAITLGYARTIGDNIRVGANIKMITSRIDDVSAPATALDLGGMMNLLEGKLTLGLAIQNAGTQIKFVTEENALPLNIKLGAKYGLLEKKLNLSLDINSRNDSGTSASLGVEYGKAIGDYCGCIRAGYNTAQTANTSGVSLGVGLGYKNYSLDMAIIPSGDFGSLSRISLGAKF
jgi:hypothetical protein